MNPRYPLLELRLPRAGSAFVPVLFALLLFGVLGVLEPPSARAQTADDALRYSQQSPGVGLRLSAMAGAGIAAGGSAGALFTNPAGLGYADESRIGAAMTTLTARDEAVFRVGSVRSVSDTRASHTAPSLVHALYSAPTVQGSLVLAGGYHVVHDYTRALRYEVRNPESSITENFLPFQNEYSVEPKTDDQGRYYEIFWDNAIPQLAFDAWAINFDGTAYENGEYPFWASATLPGRSVSLRQADEVVEEGRKSEITMGGAVEAVKGGMAGLSLNLITGTYRFDRVFEEIDTENAITGSEPPLNFDALTYTETLETDLVGVNARGGFTTDLFAGFRAGVFLETPTGYSLTDEFRKKVETLFDDGALKEAGGQGDDPGNGRFEYSLRTPWRFGGGLSYELGGIQLAADLLYVDWSQMRFDASDSEGYFDEVNRRIRSEFDPVWPYRLGLEYAVGSVALRGGYAVDPDPRSAVDAPDRSRTYYTAGLSYELGEDVRFELSWQREQFEDRFHPYANAPVNPVVSEDFTRDTFTGGLRITL